MPHLLREDLTGFILTEDGRAIEQETLTYDTYLATWVQVQARTNVEPVYVTHRGAGEDIAKDGAISSVQFTKSTGMAFGNMILDGGDGRVTSDNVLVVAHDDATGTLFDQNLTVSTSTAAQVAALRFKDFPLYRGTISTETMPTMYQYLEACKALGIFALPEVKTDAGGVLVRDAVVALGMQELCQVQAFAGTAAMADIRLGPSKAAGISVGLLQNITASNIGFPAITTCINGGPPDVVLYDPAADPGDAWISAAIAAGIRLQVGTLQRQALRDAQFTRVQNLGGKVAFFISDDPFYTSGKTMRKKISDFSTYVQHGLIKSDISVAPTVNTTRKAVQFFNTAASQFALLGAFSAPSIVEHWLTFEYDITFDTLDTATGLTAASQRWHATFFGLVNDANWHDSSTNGTGNVSCHLRQSGIMDMYARSSATVSPKVATNNSATATTGTQSDFTVSPIVAGQIVPVRHEILVDASGTHLNQVRFTRLDTGQWIQSAVGAAPLRGGYMHSGKNSSVGGTSSISNVKATYRT